MTSLPCWSSPLSPSNVAIIACHSYEVCATLTSLLLIGGLDFHNFAWKEWVRHFRLCNTQYKNKSYSQPYIEATSKPNTRRALLFISIRRGTWTREEHEYRHPPGPLSRLPDSNDMGSHICFLLSRSTMDEWEVLAVWLASPISPLIPTTIEADCLGLRRGICVCRCVEQNLKSHGQRIHAVYMSKTHLEQDS